MTQDDTYICGLVEPYVTSDPNLNPKNCYVFCINIVGRHNNKGSSRPVFWKGQTGFESKPNMLQDGDKREQIYFLACTSMISQIVMLMIQIKTFWERPNDTWSFWKGQYHSWPPLDPPLVPTNVITHINNKTKQHRISEKSGSSALDSCHDRQCTEAHNSSY